MVLKLETIVGTLSDAVRKLRKGTFQTSAEITTERRTNEDLRDCWFWTANIGVYEHNEDGSLSYYIGDRTAFNTLAAKNIDEFCTQLSSNGNYNLADNQRKSLKKLAEQGHAVKVNPDELRLQWEEKEWQYFEIDTRDYSSLTKSQRALAEMVYGAGQKFDKNMEGLAKGGISTTRIYVLNPEYVRSNVENGSAVARAGRLDGFGDSSDFSAGERYASNQRALRGVPVKSPKATRGENAIPDYKGMYQAMIANPAEAARHLTRKTATGVLSVLNAFYNPRKS